MSSLLVLSRQMGPETCRGWTAGVGVGGRRTPDEDLEQSEGCRAQVASQPGSGFCPRANHTPWVPRVPLSGGG